MNASAVGGTFALKYSGKEAVSKGTKHAFAMARTIVHVSVYVQKSITLLRQKW